MMKLHNLALFNSDRLYITSQRNVNKSDFWLFPYFIDSFNKCSGHVHLLSFCCYTAIFWPSSQHHYQVFLMWLSYKNINSVTLHQQQLHKAPSTYCKVKFTNCDICYISCDQLCCHIRPLGHKCLSFLK